MDFLFQQLAILLDPDLLMHFGERVLSHNFTQMTIAFTLAAFIHSAKMKKEINLAFSGLTDAINNVANKVTAEMTNIKTEIHNLTDRVDKIEGISKPQ